MSQNFCTQCGEKLPEEGNFCTQCGAPIEREVAPAASPPPSAQSSASPSVQLAAQTETNAQQSGMSRTVLYGLGGVAVVAVLLAVVYFAFLRPASVESDCGDEPCTVDLATIPDVHDDQGIPFPDVARVSVEEAYAGFEDGTSIFIDVRDQDAYTTMHIPGAVWMPLDQVSARHGELPVDAEILTYCTWPNEESSARAAQILKEHGFTDVKTITGGFLAWFQADYPRESGFEP